MQQRKDEIHAKRAKLAELKRQRELRQEGRAQRGPTPEPAAPLPSRTENRKEDLDTFISSVLGESGSASHSPKHQLTRPTSAASSTKLPVSVAESNSGNPKAQYHATSISTQTLAQSDLDGEHEIVTSTSTRQLEIISYSVAVQTSEPWTPIRRHRSGNGSVDSEDERSPSTTRTPKNKKILSRREREREEDLRERLRQELQAELKVPRETGTQLPAGRDENQTAARILQAEELAALVSDDEFLGFVERSSKVAERRLDQGYDVLADYALEGLRGFDEDDEHYGASKGNKVHSIREVAQFYDERWSKKRMISDVNFSPKFPELLVAAYTKNPAAPQDPSGLLQVWNLHLHSRPEYIFHSASDILTVQFSPFHPSLLLGGTYSGQVLLWDTRSRSPLPVQKTPLTGASAGGHTHPVYCINVVGTQNANNIISCSTDGVVCSWSVDMLSQPQEHLELMAPAPSKTEDLSPTCMAFPPSDPTSFLVGTEEGTLHPCHRYDRAGAKAGIDSRIRYRGHTAPVMSVDYHPARGPLDMSDLVLTSSLDWSVKIWKTQAPSTAAAAAPPHTSMTFTTNMYSSNLLGPGPSPAQPNLMSQDIAAVLDIPCEDVVYSARWSPTRPSVLGVVDGAGSLEIWDLNADTEIPVAKASPTVNKKITGYVARSLNKVAWEEKEGKRVGVGGASGVATIFEVGPGLGGEGQREEWFGLRRLVGKGDGIR